MDNSSAKRDTAVSMRFRDGDLALIDRGAALNGLSRTEFMRKAALQEAQIAILNETVIRLSPTAFDEFTRSLEQEIAPAPGKLIERISRPYPWKE